MKNLTAIFEDGARAHRLGKWHSDCPFKLPAEKSYRDAWIRGYRGEMRKRYYLKITLIIFYQNMTIDPLLFSPSFLQ